MKKIRNWINAADINRFRFWFQLGAFVLLIYGGFYAINIGDRLPTFACVFNDDRGGACYLMGFQHQTNIKLSQLFTGRGMGLLIGLLTFIGFFLLFNKAWCGYACPLGTLQDWITILRAKLKIRYSEYSQESFKKLNKIKYILLALLIMIPLGMSNSVFGLPTLSHDFAVPFCMICPGRVILPAFVGDFSQMVIDFSSKTKLVFTALGMSITGLFLAGAFVKKRFFCLFCPMSAFHYIFHKGALLRLTKHGEKCTKCGNCYRVCDVGIREIAEDVINKNIVKDDCMMCLKCVAACPEEKCLQVRFIGLPVYESTPSGFFRRMKRKTEK